MATTLGFKDFIDLPMWRPESPPLAANVAGMCLASDLRNGPDRHPYIFLLRSNTALDFYDPTTGEWFPLASPALAGTFGAGACAVFHPSQGPRGTLAVGATTSSVVLNTALAAAVGINQLANRGDGVGFKIKIIGNASGSSGKTEIRTIVGNTGGTTPTIYLDSALSFTPATGDAYEIISGKVYLLGAGTTAAGTWRSYDLATNSYATLSQTNLPATISSDSSLLAMSELHVSNDQSQGAGFLLGGTTYNGGLIGAIQATATASTTITGSGMPSNLRADEYRNFQVRVVEDTTTPTAVGQRRKITTHTSGATGVFTVGTAWTVTPSSSAKFVVENNDDWILLRSSANTTVYTYSVSGNAWDASITFSAPGNSSGQGVILEQAFGAPRDPNGNFRHSQIFCVRGAGLAAIDVLDIAAATTGSWTADIVYGNKGQTFTTGTCGIYGSATMGGRFLHMNVNGTQRHVRFDMVNRVMDAETYLRFPPGTAYVGGKLAIGRFTDTSGTPVQLSFIYEIPSGTTSMFSLAIQR